MSSQENTAATLNHNLQAASSLFQKAMGELFSKQSSQPYHANAQPLPLSKAFHQVMAQLCNQPETLLFHQVNYGHQYLDLLKHVTDRLFGEETAPPYPNEARDRRFNDEAWHENVFFDFFRQSYLMTNQWAQSLISDVKDIDPKTVKQASFYFKNAADALCPANFSFLNPQIIKETFSSQGKNLVTGMENLLRDIEKSGLKHRISTTDMSAFTIGENLAITPGDVVFQNDIIQLIHYQPLTHKRHSSPMLIVPPWINKFYILDLRPENSMVKWMLEQGHEVFLISWRNPDQTLHDKDFEDYMLEGPLAAMQEIRKLFGETKICTMGYCLGGTLLASTLAYLAYHQKDWVASATLLTTLLDFKNAGDLTVFIDDEQISAIEATMAAQGFLEGYDLSNIFSMLRANDMIWSYVVNNYLLGKDHIPFDLLYWNADPTRLPEAMHSFCLRNMYQHNLLIEPGGISLLNTPIDLRRINVPVYMLSTREDHIAPWQATYAGTQLLQCPVTYVLGGSGHIAGVINAPSKSRYGYWTNDYFPISPADWYDQATAHEGSWWMHWNSWQRQHAGELAIRDTMRLPVLEAAPGAYVKQRYEVLAPMAG